MLTTANNSQDVFVRSHIVDITKSVAEWMGKNGQKTLEEVDAFLKDVLIADKKLSDEGREAAIRALTRTGSLLMQQSWSSNLYVLGAVGQTYLTQNKAAVLKKPIEVENSGGFDDHEIALLKKWAQGPVEKKPLVSAATSTDTKLEQQINPEILRNATTAHGLLGSAAIGEMLMPYYQKAIVRMTSTEPTAISDRADKNGVFTPDLAREVRYHLTELQSDRVKLIASNNPEAAANLLAAATVIGSMLSIVHQHCHPTIPRKTNGEIAHPH